MFAAKHKHSTPSDIYYNLKECLQAWVRSQHLPCTTPAHVNVKAIRANILHCALAAGAPVESAACSMFHMLVCSFMETIMDNGGGRRCLLPHSCCTWNNLHSHTPSQFEMLGRIFLFLVPPSTANANQATDAETVMLDMLLYFLLSC